LKSLSWYQGKAGLAGYSDLDSANITYLKSKTGLSQGSVNDHTIAMLTALGYTSGSINDRLRAFYAAKTGLSINLSYSQLENAFYSSGANDFV
jgi:hypothetical protein